MKLLITILTIMLTLGLANASGFEKTAKFRTITVEMSSEKPLTTGINKVTFEIEQKSKALKEAQVKVKVFMPEMPGMPAMNAMADAKSLGAGKYEAKLNFSMGGTWQMHIFIVTKEGKKYRVKSSVNI